MLTARQVYEELASQTDATLYIEPPENIKMVYPAAVITTTGYRSRYANNKKYQIQPRIQVMVVSRQAQHPLVDLFVRRPRCRHSNHLVKDGLHHDYFTLS